MDSYQEKRYTMEDIYALPDGERAELMDGQIYYMALPSTIHQRILSFLHYHIAQYIQLNNGSCEVLPAPFAVFLSREDKSYVEPDISVICDGSRLTEQGCVGAPDWIIEIVSKSSRKMDYYKKLFKYRTAGVREYWVVDVDKDLITVYSFEVDNMEEYGFQDLVPSGIFKDFSINMQELKK